MNIDFYREGRYGDLIIYAAVNNQYLLGKHFAKEGANKGTSWVLPDYKGRYQSTLEEWKKDVLLYKVQDL